MADKLTVSQTKNGLLVGGLTFFDLDETMDCGQCFRFDRLPDGGWRRIRIPGANRIHSMRCASSMKPARIAA